MTDLLLSPFKTGPLTVADVAEITGFHSRTITRKARMKEIPGAYQIGGKSDHWRFKRKEFETWWKAQGNN
jgi:excisionase family DNA binding protein